MSRIIRSRNLKKPNKRKSIKRRRLRTLKGGSEPYQRKSSLPALQSFGRGIQNKFGWTGPEVRKKREEMNRLADAKQAKRDEYGVKHLKEIDTKINDYKSCIEGMKEFPQFGFGDKTTFKEALEALNAEAVKSADVLRAEITQEVTNEMSQYQDPTAEVEKSLNKAWKIVTADIDWVKRLVADPKASHRYGALTLGTILHTGNLPKLTDSNDNPFNGKNTGQSVLACLKRNGMLDSLSQAGAEEYLKRRREATGKISPDESNNAPAESTLMEKIAIHLQSIVNDISKAMIAIKQVPVIVGNPGTDGGAGGGSDGGATGGAEDYTDVRSRQRLLAAQHGDQTAAAAGAGAGGQSSGVLYTDLDSEPQEGPPQEGPPSPALGGSATTSISTGTRKLAEMLSSSSAPHASELKLLTEFSTPTEASGQQQQQQQTGAPLQAFETASGAGGSADGGAGGGAGGGKPVVDLKTSGV
jgi:hypothetical protein